MNSRELAQAVDLPQPTVHRLVTGKSTRPYLSSLEPIAEYFSIEIDQLLGEKPFSSEALSSQAIVNIPLIAWDNLKSREKQEGVADIPFIGAISVDGFATTMRDTSMEPLIPRNAILIFDPDLQPNDRSYVLVQLGETKCFVLRELLIDADYHYLKPLNPDLSVFKMRLLDKGDKIVACLVEVRHNFRTDNQPTLEKKTHA
jgi:SOS-response transcriptional repressor LexA